MGYDRFCRNRERVLDPDRARKLLRDTAAGADWSIRSVEAVEIVKEWPGRRLTVRYTVTALLPGTRRIRVRVYGKLYRGQRGASVHTALQFLADAPTGFRTPRPLGYDARRRFLLTTEVAGQSVEARLASVTSAQRTTLLDRLARAITAFHSLTPDDRVDWRPHTAADEAGLLATAAARLRTVAWPPDLQRAWDDCRAEAMTRLGDGAAPATAIIHRDLHLGQILADANDLGLVDFDDVALGEPELDVGNLAAHILLAVVRRDAGANAADIVRLLDGYSKCRPLNLDRERVYRAAALLRLASLERLAAQGAATEPWPVLARGLIHGARQALGGD